MSETKVEKKQEQKAMQLENMTPTQLVNSPDTAERFIKLYSMLHGRDGKVFYEAEKFHFLKQLNDNVKLQQCTKLSLYGCFLDAAVSGLSFDPSMKHCYLVPFGGKVVMMISGQGELFLRQRNGQIKYADNPVLVYEGDVFKYGIKDGGNFVEHEAVIPRKPNAKMIACYLRLTRNDDTIDYKVMTMEELMNLKKFSKDPNSKAWTDGLSGMFASKVIKHAFKNYPKFRMGRFSKLETEEVEETTATIDYGIAIPENGIGTTDDTSESFSPVEEKKEEPPVIHSDAGEDEGGF